MLTHHSVAPASNIPLLAEEGWRDSRREARARQGEASRKAEAPGWSVRPKRFAELLLRLRPIGLALRATPSAPAARWLSAHPPLPARRGIDSRRARRYDRRRPDY